MFDLTKLPFKVVMRLINFYPPYLGAGVRVRLVDEENVVIKVSMPLNVSNKNYVGTHFGGSLYSMVDPFYMFILMTKLGRDYIVWDKSASIHFKRPGRGKVHAHFEISADKVQEIREAVEKHGKWEPEFKIDVVNDSNQVVCSVNKTLWVKKKT